MKAIYRAKSRHLSLTSLVKVILCKFVPLLTWTTSQVKVLSAQGKFVPLLAWTDDEEHTFQDKNVMQPGTKEKFIDGLYSADRSVNGREGYSAYL